MRLRRSYEMTTTNQWWHAGSAKLYIECISLVQISWSFFELERYLLLPQFYWSRNREANAYYLALLQLSSRLQYPRRLARIPYTHKL